MELGGPAVLGDGPEPPGGGPAGGTGLLTPRFRPGMAAFEVASPVGVIVGGVESTS